MFYRVLFSRNISRFGSLSGILISGVYFYSSFSAHGVRAQNFGPIKSPMKSSLIEICKSGYISTEQNSNSYISPTLKRRLQGIIPYKIFLNVAHTTEFIENFNYFDSPDTLTIRHVVNAMAIHSGL